MTSSGTDRSASRRAVLRRAAVTGGAAVAATAVAAASAAPASAATGDPVALGLPNQGTLPTTVTSSAAGGAATLALGNSTGATLHLQQKDGSSIAGMVVSTQAGLGVTGTDSGGTVREYEALTTANATMLVPIPPTRVLDTRSAAGRARLLEGAGRIDGQGRAVADSWLVVHLADIVEYGDGLFGNITVAKTERGGFATVWGNGDMPRASTINWFGANQLLSNGVITQTGPWETVTGAYYPDTISIYVQSAAAVILDVTGLLVYHPDSAVINNPKNVSGAGLAADSGTAKARADVLKATAERAGRKAQARA
jgi:hypothetical protein